MFHTRTSIINTALMRAGARGVTAGFQDSPDAQTAEAAYDRVLAYCLGLFPWSFALRRVQLAQAADAPDAAVGIHRYAYPLPADCLRVVNAHTDGERVAAWEILGRKLLCDATQLTLTYVVASVPSFPDAFADMVAWRLAFEISPYMEQGGQAQAYLEMFERALDRARVENDLENRPERTVASPFLRERRGDLAAGQARAMKSTPPRCGGEAVSLWENFGAGFQGEHYRDNMDKMDTIRPTGGAEGNSVHSGHIVHIPSPPNLTPALPPEETPVPSPTGRHHRSPRSNVSPVAAGKEFRGWPAGAGAAFARAG